MPVWEQRFRAARIGLPEWARDAPHRCVYVGNESGRFEVHAWDRATGERRQVTDRPHGTTEAAVDPTGQWVWWFDDTDGDEFGRWRREPFGGGAAAPVDLPAGPGYPAGLALGVTVAVAGVSNDAGTSVYVVPLDGGAPRLVYRHREDAHVVDLSHDEDLIALAHSEHGDSRHMALRVLGTDGTPVAELWDGEGLGLEGVAFAPGAGERRLLALHERAGRPLPVVWDPLSGTERRLPVPLPGDVGAQWFPDRSALLLHVDSAGRADLHRLDLADERLSRLDTPAGTVSAATARPDGSVEYQWSSGAAPPAIRSTTGAVVLRAPGAAAPASVPVHDAWVDGPAGPVHTLVSKPAHAQAPLPTVVLVHGGPQWHEHDAFAADVAAWVDHGFAVVRPNYRGSTGYGTQWRDAIEGRPGLTELEDLAAVRDWAVRTGLADPDRVVLAGGSWGGYLTLLGVGARPELWSLGIAAVPVADYVAAYEDEMEALQAFDRALFGGSPQEVPDRYAESSPISYVEQVRVPLLVLAGANDPRCPIRQIDRYLARLAELGRAHEVYRYDAGHGALVVDERVRQMAAELDFARRHLSR